MSERSYTEKPESAETNSLRAELRKEEQAEDKAWGIKTDKAAFSREKFKIPERWD